MEPEEILELNYDGDIVSGKEEAVEALASNSSAKTYVSTRTVDKSAHTLDKSDYQGLYIRAPPTPLKTLLGEGGLHDSDKELVKQSLIAWRHHLSCQNKYKPDKILPIETYKAHVRILMSALSNFNDQRVKNRFTKKAKLLYKHDQYTMMYTAYHVPVNACFPYELMSKVDGDRDILYRLRCVRRLVRASPEPSHSKPH